MKKKLREFTPSEVESLHMLGYFEQPCTADFVCGLVGCESVVKKTSTGKYVLVRSSTSSASISAVPTFDSLAERILDYQQSSSEYDLFDFVRTHVTASESGARVIRYVFAKSKASKQNLAKKLVRVKSSNVWAYYYDIELGRNTGNLYVQFKSKNGGPGDIYQYLDFPIKLWKKFVSTSSKGHYFWKYIRNNFRYRKLTGDKKGKLANAIN